MSYRLDYSAEARQDVRRLPGNYRQRIRRLIESLADNPRPRQAILLRESEDIYRIRIDRWRLIYAVEDDSARVTIIRVKPKKGPETYKNLPPN